MGKIIKSHDDVPVREYKAFLERFNNLKDCSWFWFDDHKDRDRFTNTEMELLRNGTGGVVYLYDDNENVKKIIKRGRFTPTQSRLAAHRADKKKRSAVWMTNGGNQDLILCLLDFDKKTSRTRCRAAAKHFINKYLGGRGYIEMSTGRKGIHVYFFIDMKYVKRADFIAALPAFYAMLNADEVFASLRQTFDPVPLYGTPTVWAKDEFDNHTIVYRGNQLKCPYFPKGRSDLEALKALSAHPLSAGKLVRWAATQTLETPSSPPPPSSRQVAQIKKPQSKPMNEGSGPKRRASLYVKMKSSNPKLTEDEFVAAYTIQTTHNGGEEKVRRDFQRMEERFIVRQKKATAKIDMCKYLDVVRDVVPPLAMVTKKRRTKLDHERVAQFVAVKMHDANQLGEHQAASARDTTLSFWATLREKGIVDWALTTNTHSKLMSICTTYKLLEIIEEHTGPSAPAAKDGRCRRVGPGEALGEEYERYEFTRRRLQAEAVEKAARKVAL